MSDDRRENNGTWLEGPEAPHKCDKPELGPTQTSLGMWVRPKVSINSVWRCDCGTAWIAKDSQRDGPYWQRIAEHDASPKGQVYT